MFKKESRYITRGANEKLDLRLLELMELIKKSIKEKIFSDDFIEMLKQELK